jgi:hypothetical protein
MEEFFGDLAGNAETSGGIFAVGYDQVDGAFLHQWSEAVAHDVAPRPPKNVAYKENAHGLFLENYTLMLTEYKQVVGRRSLVVGQKEP